PATSAPTVDAAELARRTAELEQATSSSFRAAADDVERMLAQGEPDSGRAAEVERATAAWEAAYWGSFDEAQHQIITAARPGIFSCFNQADVLISDVSSVVSDWLASEKPYAVANTSGMTEDEFRAAFTTVRAATILAPAGDGVPGLLAAVRDPGQDTLVKDRAELKLHLLGPSDPPSVSRLRDA
ncbi:hypothetical protein ACQ5JZ_33880, partial [Streptomyces sp. ZG43]